MRAKEFITEDEWQRITPADLPTPKATAADADREAKKQSNIEYHKQHPKQDPSSSSYDTSKLGWWRKGTTDPKALKFRQDIKTQGDLYAALGDPDRLAKLSKIDPITSGSASRLNPEDPKWKPEETMFGKPDLPPEKEQSVKDYRPFRDEYSVAAEKQPFNTKDKPPEVSPSGKMFPDVKVRKTQI